MANGATASIAIQIRVKDGEELPDETTFESQVTSVSPPDPVTGNNYAGHTFRAEADLSIRVSPDTVHLAPGEQVTLTMQVENAGPCVASRSFSTVRLSPPLRILSMTASQGTCDPTEGRCDLGDLPAGGEATITMVAIADAAVSTRSERVQVECVYRDPNLGNNVDGVIIGGVQRGDLQVHAGNDGKVVLEWEGDGKLQSASNLNGPATAWTDVPGDPTSPHEAVTSERQSFFRLEWQPPRLSLPAVALYQNHLNLDGVQTTNSDWGSADVTFKGSSTVQYLNLSIGLDWRVRNVPVVSFLGPDKPHTVTVNFKLTEPGTSVTNTTFGLGFSTNTLTLAPLSTNSTVVFHRPIAVYSGIRGTNLSYRPASNLVGSTVQTWKAAKPVFPNLEQGENECVPSAVANSLQYLNSVFALGIDAGELTIEKMKEATDWTRFGAASSSIPFFGWVSDKISYMTDHNLPIATQKTTDPQAVMDALARCCDVEIEMDGHVAAIVAMADIGSGDYALTFSHDVRQGQDGDDLHGTYWGSDFITFVIECPAGQ
jgi:hypothetical protein